MNNDKNADKRFCFKFLVLVPHRDVRSLLRKHGELLIKEGITGVYQFPWAAPIAELSEDFTADELKHTAQSLRNLTSGEKFTVTEADTAAFPPYKDKMLLSGQKLDLNLPESVFAKGIPKIKKLITPLLIGSWLLPESNEQHPLSPEYLRKELSIPPAPPEKLSFRAAAVANMHWKPFKTEDETGYRWKIGKLIWLPKKVLK